MTTYLRKIKSFFLHNLIFLQFFYYFCRRIKSKTQSNMGKKNNVSLFWWVVSLTLLISTGLMLIKEIELSWVIIIAAICCALWQVWRQCQNWWQGRQSMIARRERLLRILASLMALFLATGSALYLQAFGYVNVDHNGLFVFVNAEYLLRSIVCSLNLFMLDIESNVLDQIGDHEYLKGLISIQAVLSFSCTVALLLSLVYARVRAYRKLHWQTKIDDNHNHLYVFFGMNEPSRLLARSIRNREKEQALIVIVEKSPVDDKDRGGWNSIVEMFTNREQSFTDAEEVDARITFTETRLCDVDKEKLTKNDILSEINLISLRNLIRKLYAGVKEAELHAFFLSENEDENIRAMSILAQDETINAGVGKIKQRFYCHARRNGLNRVIEDVSVKRGLDVRIIDSAHLAIELLKVDENKHPVRLVEVDKDNPTTVKSKFESLVVGFDEAGQDAVRFLYEFGAFVDSSASPEKERRSPFHCIAVDANMFKLRGVFETFAPSAMAQKDQNGRNLIELRTCDYHSKSFYDRILAPICQELNYVIISVGNDEQGMLLAIRILNYVRREREDLSFFRIYVRSYQSDKVDHMQEIANHYNEGCEQTIIVLFGQSSIIYSYDMIIDEELSNKGKQFQENYANLKGEKELWDERRAVLTGAKKCEMDESGNEIVVDVPLAERKPSIDDLRSLRRKEKQDIANALHASTKLFLLKQSLGKEYDWKGFFDRYYAGGKVPCRQGSRDDITYPKLKPKEQQATLNLARLEHLRWNASHEMLGYSEAQKDLHMCDERTRQHNCLRSWEELAEESSQASDNNWQADYKSFDFSVVDTTLFLYKDKLLEQDL